MKVEYIGPLDSVFVPAIGGHAKRGEAVEVEDEIGSLLCEQRDSWREVRPKGKGETPSPASADDAGVGDRREDE